MLCIAPHAEYKNCFIKVLGIKKNVVYFSLFLLKRMPLKLGLRMPFFPLVTFLVANVSIPHYSEDFECFVFRIRVLSPRDG